jgi:protein tyrosine/serine phosphatase
MRIAILPRRSAAIAVLSLILAAPAAAQTVAPAPAPQIYNFGKVNDDYYRGAQPLDGQYADLAALGVKTIINLTSGEDVRDDEKAMVEKHGMKYVHIPMSTRKPPTDREIAAFMAAVEEEGAVYVHCVGGRHRTGVMTAVYRMTKDGLSGEQAFKEMKQYKYGPDFLHPEFKKFVYKYDPKSTVAVAATSSQQ